MNDDLLARIRGWVNRTEGSDLPDGPRIPESLRLAAELKDRLRASGLAQIGDERATPDVLLALCEVLNRDRDPDCPGREADLLQAYEFVQSLSWNDEFNERSHVLSSLAFLAWDFWRRRENYAETEAWQARCVRHLLGQEHVRAFLSLSPLRWSPALKKRFLSDEPVLLAVCARLNGERRNLEPAIVADEAEIVYAWLEEDGLAFGLREELIHYLAAGIALAVAFAENQIGRDNSRGKWIANAIAHSEMAIGAGPLLAVADHARLITMYADRGYAAVCSESPRLIQRFETLGMKDKALRARLLRGRAMKELGLRHEALSWTEQVHWEALQSDDLLVGALALCDRAEILSELGNFADAMAACRGATELARRCECGWVVANVQGTLGELLRDHGDLTSSIDAYAASVESYDALGMAPSAAYTRVVLAETLLLAGMPTKAISTVVAALPVIEREKLAKEGVAAVAILREALRRQSLDPEALRQLRIQLQQMKEEGRL